MLMATIHRDYPESRGPRGSQSGHFHGFCTVDSWTPSVNIYRLERRYEVCMDLAGVEKTTIDVRVTPQALTVRGVRQSPEPPRQAGAAMRIMAMEIDHGPFCREVRLPDHIDTDRVESHYDNGLLWIKLPIREHA